MSRLPLLGLTLPASVLLGACTLDDRDLAASDIAPAAHDRDLATSANVLTVPPGTPDDVAAALAQLPAAEVVATSHDRVPTLLRGHLGQIDSLSTEDVAHVSAHLAPALPALLAPFRLVAAAVRVRAVHRDAGGATHVRLVQEHAGLRVIGGDLVVHVAPDGTIYAVNGTARGDLPARERGRELSHAELDTRLAFDPQLASRVSRVLDTVYLRTSSGVFRVAVELEVTGERDGMPVRDLVYVDAHDGSVLEVHPTIHAARNRRTHDAMNTVVVPGTLQLIETSRPGPDPELNTIHTNTGITYDAFAQMFGRDSIDRAGAALVSSGHYGTGVCNAYWDGVQMRYGDGVPANGCLPLGRALDVVGHELGHGITQHDSGLIFNGESGALNESLADTFGVFVKAWDAGGRTGQLLVDEDSWLLANDVLSEPLRYMCDPAADGQSLDRWASNVGNRGVHYASGIGNLMTCLLAQGGTHPRGTSTIQVAPIGFDKAIRVLYKANLDYLYPAADYPAFRFAMTLAAMDLGYDAQTIDSIGCAFAAVRAGDAPASCAQPAPEPDPTALKNGVVRTSVITSSITMSKLYWIDVPSGTSTFTVQLTGTSGNADLYVQRNAAPSTQSYLCRSAGSPTSETCTFTSAAPGRYWILVQGVSRFSESTLRATFTGTPTYLYSGVPTGALAGASGSTRTYRIHVPAYTDVTFSLAGGTGNADLDVQISGAPTPTSFVCRSAQPWSDDSCRVSSYHPADVYVTVRGTTAYSGVVLTASY